MTDYYLSSGMSGADIHEIVKNAGIKKARAVACKLLEKHEKPIRVYKITDRGTHTEYIGTIKRWGFYIDRYGIDRSDLYVCWVDVNGVGHPAYWNGTIGKGVEER